ncbi:endo-polygalacturonase, partial [Streptomyces sp. NPDC050997]
MNTPLSRRTALQAAGATVLAAGLTDLTASSARAGDAGAPVAPKRVSYPPPAGMPTNTKPRRGHRQNHRQSPRG